MIYRGQFSASPVGSYAGNEPQFALPRRKASLKTKNIGVYLDFDNLFGSLLRELGIDPRERKQKNYALLPIEVKVVREILSKFLPTFLYFGLEERFATHVRYIKAFAVFSKLPFANQIGDIQNLLHNVGIEPFPSFIAQNTKDASDRALILEVVEDIFFNQLPIDIVVIGSGDIDFYPLISFFYEHSNKYLYLLSFENSLSSLYKKIPLTALKLIDIKTLQLSPSDSESFGEILREKRNTLCKSIEESFLNFKRLFFEKLLNSEREGKEVRTGLVLSKWRKEWKKQGYNFDSNEVNHFLNLLQKEGSIKIEPDKKDTPLRGKIVSLIK